MYHLRVVTHLDDYHDTHEYEYRTLLEVVEAVLSLKRDYDVPGTSFAIKQDGEVLVVRIEN